MKKLMYSLYIIIFIALLLILLLMNFLKTPKPEGFQNVQNIITKYFNIDYDYYAISKDELSQKEVNPDELILNIGTQFGTVDVSRIPWDTENRQLSVNEALWGVVPEQAKMTLFKKIYVANQLQDLNSLPFDDKTNKFHYDDPIFLYGTDDSHLAAGLQAAGAITSFAVPMIMGYLANDMEDELREFLEGKRSHHPNKSYPPHTPPGGNLETKELGANDVGKYKKTKLNDVYDNKGKPFDAPLDDGTKNVDNAFTKNADGSYSKMGVDAEGNPKLKTFLGDGPEKILSKPPSFLDKGLAKIKAAKKFFKEVAEKMAKTFFGKAMKLFFKAIMVGTVLSTSLAFIPFIGPTIDAVYNFVLTPILIILMLPGPTGILTQVMDSLADSAGCCGPNTKAMDQVIPQGAAILISFIPVWGDIFDLFYPYICQNNTNGSLTMKSKFYVTPKYFGYAHLSCYYLNWPDYDCSTGTQIMQGKYMTTQVPSAGGVYPSLESYSVTTYNPIVNGMQLSNVRYINTVYDYSSRGNYVNLNDVRNNPEAYKFTRKRLEGFNPVYNEFRIVPAGKKFFYIDFSDQNILIQMAQFYYNFSSRNIFPNSDGRIIFSYISKINFVVASSLYTCDVLCELTEVSYKFNDPSDIEETISFDHDRRFYFSCTEANNAPDYWENTSTPTWTTLDDEYDRAVFNLEHYINSGTFNNSNFTGAYIQTAYEVMKRITVRYNNALAENVNVDQLFGFQKDSETANINFGRILQGFRKAGTTASDAAIQSNTIVFYCEKVINAKDALRTLQRQQQPYNPNYVHSQYKLFGCTRLDSTAPSALEPDITAIDEDFRKEVQLDVTPYLVRCKEANITTSQCIDLSNVELIIDKYAQQFPNKEIKSIHKITAIGNNTCQFVWDEQVKDSSTVSRVKYDILYQQDLSSCSFVLPSQLYTGNTPISAAGATNGSINNPIPTSVKMIHRGAASDPVLDYKKAISYTITKDSYDKMVYTRNTDTDIVPRYDLVDGTRLPDLIRPKKPIRVTYPQLPQSNLGNQSNNYCSNEETMKKFIVDYNSSNTNKILKVIRTYTTSSNVCDMEVDVLSGTGNNRTIQRKTVSYKMKEGFQNRYTYDSLNNNNGLNIRNDTEYNTSNKFTGLFSEAYLNDYIPSVTPNVVFFNDNLVTQFTSTTKTVLNKTSDIIVSMIGNQYLANDTVCGKQCTDPEIKQRILEQYNLDNAELARYGATHRVMDTIFKSANNDATTCHIYFSENQNTYLDRFALDLNNSSNLTNVRKPFLREVQMRRVSGCTFAPVVRQEYIDISATNLSLQSGADLTDATTWTASLRPLCTNLDCRNNVLSNAAFNDFHSKTYHRINSVQDVVKVNPDTCDYLINFNYNGPLGTADNQPAVLRVKYNYPIYTTGGTCGTFSYTPSIFDQDEYKSNNLELQFAFNIDVNNPDISPLVNSNNIL